jgi:phosphatidate cytidylyltransferase
VNFDHLTKNILIAYGAIFFILILGTLISYLKKIRNPQKNYTELILRIKSWWVIVLGFFIATLLGGNALIALIGIVSLLGLRELLKLIYFREADQRTILWIYLTVPIQYYWIFTHWYGMFIIFIPVYMFVFYAIGLVLSGDMKGFIRSASVLHWTVMITVFSISHIGYLAILPLSKGQPAADGIGLVVFLIFMTQINDVLQYVWGKSLGKTKLIPKVSPNKTVEGLVGGVLSTAVLSGVIAPLVTPMSPVIGTLAGAIIGIAGFFGDVTMSAIKRDLGVKDMSNLIPGHGGVLDRIDSLVYSAPIFFHFIHYSFY